MTLTRRGQFWHYRFRHRGQEFSGSTKCTSHRDAREYESQFRARLALGEVGVTTPPPLARAWEHWRDSMTGQLTPGHMARAESAFRLHILPIMGEIRCDMITEDYIQALRSKYLDGKSFRKFGTKPRTKSGANTLVGYLKAVLNHLVRIGILRRLPFNVVPLRSQQKVRPNLPLLMIPNFLDAIDARGSRDLSLACRVMLFMGLRESEALGMRWEWFSPSMDSYTPGLTKGKEAVAIPVPPQVSDLLSGGSRLSPWVIPSIDGRPHRPQFTKKAVKAAGESIGVENLSPHGLRASCATLMAKGGINLRIIQKLLRHKDIRTTLLYVDIGMDDMRKAQSAIFGAS